METPPQNAANRQYNYVNRYDTPSNLGEEIIRHDRQDYLQRANQKGHKSQQPSDKEQIIKILGDFRKLLKYVDDTNWMFDKSDVVPADLMQNTI